MAAGSETWTASAVMDVMISLHKELSMFKNHSLNVSQDVGGKATIPCDGHRVKPKFTLATRCADMYVRRLISFVGIEMKTIRTYAQHRWHNQMAG
jgi:hypothetical protein